MGRVESAKAVVTGAVYGLTRGLDHTAAFESARELIEASGELRKPVAHFAMVARDDVREIGKIPLDASYLNAEV